MSLLHGGVIFIVDERKLVDYLLSVDHPAGRAKAAFFRRFGFTAAMPERLRQALLVHAMRATVLSEIDTPFGRKFVLDGPVYAPDGRAMNIRSVWFIELGEVSARLVTAYPSRGV